jgi:hypothetical protein
MNDRKLSGMDQAAGDRIKIGLLGLALASLVAGFAPHVAGLESQARLVWGAGVAPVLAALMVEIARILQRGEVGLDMVAALSMSQLPLRGRRTSVSAVSSGPGRTDGPRRSARCDVNEVADKSHDLRLMVTISASCPCYCAAQPRDKA